MHTRSNRTSNILLENAFLTHFSPGNTARFNGSFGNDYSNSATSCVMRLVLFVFMALLVMYICEPYLLLDHKLDALDYRKLPSKVTH